LIAPDLPSEFRSVNISSTSIFERLATMFHLPTVETARNIKMELRSRLERRSAQQLPAHPLFHYTDANGLLEITKSCTLWATHSQYLNDSSEFIYASKLMKDVAAEIAAEVDADSPGGRLILSILEGDDETGDSKESENEWLLEYFVTSFS